MILLDVLKTFAAMPNRQGVLKAFDKAASGSKFPAYPALRNQIEALPTPVVLPEITDFIFGLDAETINDHIRNIKDVFMMVEYGVFQGNSLFDVRNRDVDFLLTIFIGKTNQGRNLHIIEHTMLMDELLTYVQRMLQHIEQTDRDRCGATRYMDGAVTILPIQPLILLNCHGWEVSFKKKANDLFFYE